MKMRGLLMSMVLAASLGFSTFAQAENFRFSPIGALIGVINGEVDFDYNGDWTFGPSFAYWALKRNGVDVNLWSLGVQGVYSLNGKSFTDGWYFSPEISYGAVDIEKDDDTYGTLKGDSSGYSLHGIFGYQWFWKTFNMNLGAGFSYFSGGGIELKDNTDTVREDYDELTAFAAEFSIGFLF